MNYKKFLGAIFDSNSKVRELWPSTLKRTVASYLDVIGLGKNFTFNVEGFEKHDKSRVKDHTAFKTKLVNGNGEEVTLDKLLNESEDKDAVTALKTMFQEVFKPDLKYEHAMTRYKETIEAAQKQLQSPTPPTPRVDVIRGTIEEAQQQALNAIKYQQLVERKSLKENLKNSNALAKVAKIEGEKITDAQTKLIQDLEAKHKAQIAEFDKSCQNNLAEIDKGAAREINQILLGAYAERLADRLDPKQRQEFRNELAQWCGVTPPTQTGVQTTRGKRSKAHALDPNNITKFFNITGSQITRNDKKGSFSVEMDIRLFAPFYYDPLGLKESNPKIDMMTLAMLVKATGADKIKFTVNYGDDETTKQRAKQAYEASIEQGFEFDKISVIDGRDNKQIPADQLFSPEEIVFLKEKSAKAREEFKNIETDLKKMGSGDVDRYKNELKTYKAKSEEELNTLKEEEEAMNRALEDDAAPPAPS